MSRRNWVILVVVALVMAAAVVYAAGGTHSDVGAQDVGRYQIYFSPHTAAFTVLLDTQAGTVWLLRKSEEDVVWQRMRKAD